MTVRPTPNRGIRVAGFDELAQPAALRVMAEDLDTVATKTDALRSAAIRRPRAFVTRASGSQSITKNTWTKLTGLDTVQLDNGSTANLGVNNDRLTCTSAGVFLCNAYAYTSFPSDPDEIRLAIAKNTATSGSADFIQKSLWSHSSSAYQPDVGAAFLLAVNDFLTVWVFWNGGPVGPVNFSNYGLSITQMATNP